MLKAYSSNLPPLIITSRIAAVKRSLIPTSSLSSLFSSRFHTHTSIFFPLNSLHKHTNSHSHFLKWVSFPMSGHTFCPKASSFSSGNGSEDERELLVQHLLVKEDDLKLLVELQQRIAGGEDLSDLAVEYSICPSKSEGGMLGWVRKGQMVPEFEEAAFSAPLNKVVKCKTKFGWHLLQVLSDREAPLLQDISPEDFHVKMQDAKFVEEVQLIDVREPDEVEKASLPGFQILPLRQFGSWASEITTKLDLEKDTYVMCHHGMRSLQVAKWLQTQGFKRIFNVAGGIHAYAVKVDPSVPTY